MQLDRFNEEPSETLTPSLLACCDAPSWVAAVEQGRPFADTESLYAAADAAARRLTSAEVGRAIDAHPRIGEKKSARSVGGPDTESGWSRDEQSGVSSETSVQAALKEGNRAYEQRFGRVFLICATGLTAEQVLQNLHSRLPHDTETENGVVAGELRKIALLRLRKVLES